jgi:predicted dehydrogenase
VEDVDRMLDDPGIEGILLATPHSTHADYIERAAASGKHVFVEKPLALTVTDAKRASAAARTAGVVLQVGHNRRRQPANRRIKAMIETGELGTVLQLQGMHGSPIGFKPDLPAWRRDPEELPFGGMTGLGVHTVDTFNYFVGRAHLVSAFSKRVDDFLEIDETTSVTIEYESGPLGSICTSPFVPPVVWLAVHGSGASAWSDEDGARLQTQTLSEARRRELAIEDIDTIVDEMGEFATCIKEGLDPETGAEEGLEVAVVLEAIGQSVSTGCAVDASTLR